jgi:hypothetical protein
MQTQKREKGTEHNKNSEEVHVSTDEYCYS